MLQRAMTLINRNWLLEDQHREKGSLVLLAPANLELVTGARTSVKYRRSDGSIGVEDDLVLEANADGNYVRSKPLFEVIASSANDYLMCFIEGAPSEIRVIMASVDAEDLHGIDQHDPTLRLEVFGVPPLTITTATNRRIQEALYDFAREDDAELLATHASDFLQAPHVLIPLFSHLMSLGSSKSIDFPIKLKKVADQLRAALLGNDVVTIKSVDLSHAEFWPTVKEQRVAFLDGGVARIPGVAGLEPLAMRVGMYCVRPGDVSDLREQWNSTPFVIADLVEEMPTGDNPETRKRLQEAARYLVEPLVALHSANQNQFDILFSHGPLINQFVTYDDELPYELPEVKEEFLSQFGITRWDVMREIAKIPEHSNKNEPLWNQWIALYAYVMRKIAATQQPIAGVVERVAGRSVTGGVLQALEDNRVIDEVFRKKVLEILGQYDIHDDFLFGCILKGGEYVTPVEVDKNKLNRTHDRWRPVVQQYPKFHATMLKTDGANFPFRVEFNYASHTKHPEVLRLLHHTARLLPRYAFPVGLDIADKFAKIPDWLSKGVSSQLAAMVLRRAVAAGDENVVIQVKKLLARGPRDFFYRPGTQ